MAGEQPDHIANKHNPGHRAAEPLKPVTDEQTLEHRGVAAHWYLLSEPLCAINGDVAAQ